MKLTLALDVGQQQDPSAWVLLATEDGIHRVGWAQRMALGLPYQTIVDDVVAAADQAAQLEQSACDVIIDHGGVGRPIVELMRNATPQRVVGVTSTGGERVTQVDGDFRTPKSELIGNLMVVVEGHRLVNACQCEGATQLEAEMRSFTYATTPSGNVTYQGPGGHRDDLIAALALGVWWASRSRRGGVLRFRG